MFRLVCGVYVCPVVCTSVLLCVVVATVCAVPTTSICSSVLCARGNSKICGNFFGFEYRQLENLWELLWVRVPATRKSVGTCLGSSFGRFIFCGNLVCVRVCLDALFPQPGDSSQSLLRAPRADSRSPNRGWHQGKEPQRLGGSGRGGWSGPPNVP